MIKNIILLTKVSTRNFLENFQIFDKDKKTVNKKSMYVWLFLIIIIAIAYLTIQILQLLHQYGQTDLFLDIMLLLVMTILIMQTIISSMNILYFAKDMEYFLMYPIKTKELLLSRTLTMLNITYFTECILLFIPLILYGNFVMMHMSYYIFVILALLLLPIFPVLLVNNIFLIIMKVVKKIKHKNVFQFMITLVFLTIFIVLEVIFIKNFVLNKIDFNAENVDVRTIISRVNDTFVIVNPIIEILNQKSIFMNILKILGIDAFLYVLFIFLGNKFYINNILKTTQYHKLKAKKRKEIKHKYHVKTPRWAYLKNDIKGLFGNTTFFLQMVYPFCLTIITIISFSTSLRFTFMPNNLDLYDMITNLHLNIEGVCVMVGLLQILMSFYNISITAISRMGKNAIFLKYIPMELYKQCLLKNIPQSFMTIIVSIVLLLAIKLVCISVSWIQILCMLPICMVVGILNSYIMLIVDIKRPILNWNSEMEIFKQNGNKIFQYIWTIVMVLILMYIASIFEEVNLYIAMLVMFVFFTALLLGVNQYVKVQIKKEKLFKNII